MTREFRQVTDTKTGKVYNGTGEAGRALASEVGGDPKDRLVWFKVAKAFPGRFKISGDPKPKIVKPKPLAQLDKQLGSAVTGRIDVGEPAIQNLPIRAAKTQEAEDDEPKKPAAEAGYLRLGQYDCLASGVVEVMKAHSVSDRAVPTSVSKNEKSLKNQIDLWYRDGSALGSIRDVSMERLGARPVGFIREAPTSAGPEQKMRRKR